MTLGQRHLKDIAKGYAKGYAIAYSIAIAFRSFRSAALELQEWRTVPNALTSLRLCAVPGLVVAWYWPSPAVAAGIFATAAVTESKSYLSSYVVRSNI